jgi:radical SAM superfamily enzyme YgiQ (UPF0313 family)
LNIRWIGQATINLGRHPELCRLAARSGCCYLGIGVESINQRNLEAVNKRFNRVEDFGRLLAAIRENGVGLCLNMIVGLDHDDQRIFEETTEFLIRNRALYVVLHLPVPYPGTAFFSRLEREGRLLTRDWSKYLPSQVIFQPRLMTASELMTGYRDVLNHFYSWKSILKRFPCQPKHSRRIFWDRNIKLHRAISRGGY